MKAKKELLVYTVKENIRCAFITYSPTFDDKDDQDIILKDNHSKKDLAAFLRALSFEYDNGYGRQFIYGTVWLKDGNWLERREYDGSEWWVHQVLPKLPKECQDV